MLMNSKLFELPRNEIHLCGLQNLTYGSLSTKGMNTLANKISCYKQPFTVVGMDLGCGDGELIYHFEQILEGSKWEGVEISQHRVNQQVRDVCIWQGDMLEENLRPYNVLHADNLCLEDDIADKLEEKIAVEFEGIYITYRTPQNLKFLRNAALLETVITETTWTNHPIHFYLVF